MPGRTSGVAFMILTFCMLTANAGSAASVDEVAGSLRRGSSGRAVAVGEEQQQKHRHRLTLGTPQAEHQLVICNAYTSKKGLDVVHVRSTERLTGSSPLAYKQCREFTMPLQEGDQLDFQAGNLDVGTFYATGLPKSSTSLLLVPHRRAPHSSSVSFESHAFADIQSPQIAVVDAYKGHSEASVKIIESHKSVSDSANVEKGTKDDIEENLNFNSVVALNPGKYKVALLGSSSNIAMPLSAKDKTKYVVVRVGSEDSKTDGAEYAQELIVYPESASCRTHLSLLAVVALSMPVLLGLSGSM